MYMNSVVPATTGNVSYDSKESAPCFHFCPALVSDNNPAALKEPYAYLLQIPGKRIRSKLIDAFDIWLDIPSATKMEIKGFNFFCVAFAPHQCQMISSPPTC